MVNENLLSNRLTDVYKTWNGEFCLLIRYTVSKESLNWHLRITLFILAIPYMENIQNLLLEQRSLNFQMFT